MTENEEQQTQAQQGRSEWHWRVIVETEERGELILGAMEPHRAAAKQYVADRLDTAVTAWKRVYIPRPSWDCPACGTHEAATKQPNLRSEWDWECMVCFTRFWGEPMDWDRVELGSEVPDHRSTDHLTGEADG